MLDLEKPNKLSKGDKVATVSLSWGGAGDSEFIWRYKLGKKRLEEEFGLEVIEMPNTLKGTEYIYNHPEKRAEDLMAAFEDKTIKGIFTCIGGNESINWSEIKMIQKEEQEVYDALNLLKIKYVRYEHKPIYTVNEGKELDISLLGKKCKNLFLKNGRGDINYMVILDEDKSINLKSLAKEIGSTRLSFESEEKLFEKLKLTSGSVTPFGIINDVNREVVVLIDSELIYEKILNFHPNINTATIGISYIDFEKFIRWHDNEFHNVEIK